MSFFKKKKNSHTRKLIINWVIFGIIIEKRYEISFGGGGGGVLINVCPS